MRTTLNFTYTFQWKKNPQRGTRRRIFIHTQHGPLLLLGPSWGIRPEYDLENIFWRLVQIRLTQRGRIAVWGQTDGRHYYLRPDEIHEHRNA